MGARYGQKNSKAGAQRRALVVFGVLLVVLLVGFAVAQGIGAPSVPSGDVAKVEGISEGDSSVSEAEFKRAMVQAAAQSGLKTVPKEGTAKYDELMASALGGLIDRIWVLGQAEELGISATKKQIATELEQIKEQNFPTPQAYAEFLETSKLNQEDVDRQVELQVVSKQIQSQITAEAPVPSNDEIADFYEFAKASQFTTKPTRDVRVIVNKDKAEVEAAKVELEKDSSPANWKKVAAKYSTDPSTKDKGGLQPALSEELVESAGAPLKNAIFKSATGELSEPVKFQGNYAVVEVQKINAEKVQTLAEVRQTILGELQQRASERYFEEFVSSYQSKWESRTFCASGFEIQRCSNYPSSAKAIAEARKPYESCYEDNPKVPPKECPAPVTQSTPALPGTVTVIQPNGTRLPQRPVEPKPAGKAREAVRQGVEEATGE